MSKSKPRSGPSQVTGTYKSDSIKDVAEFLGIAIPDTVASALASDVEYRIHQVVEEAARFMRHGRRTTMTTSDIDHALRVLNIEPLYGHTPHNPPVFRRAPPFSNMIGSGPVFFVEDEEIDFDRVLREDKIALPKGVSWTAHWLAVEGVQPLIPENPPPVPREVIDPEAVPQTNGFLPPSMAKPASKKEQLQQQQLQLQQQLVKQVLSRELQLYYTRLTAALLPPSSDYARRNAALASLKNDAGLQALLPYLVRWIGDAVVMAVKEGDESDTDGRSLEVMIDVIGSILENKTMFVEPYLHQILPSILSILLHSSLPPSHGMHLRIKAAQTLSRLLTQHSTTYPSLSPRIMKTLLLALISPGKSIGTREGAVRGLTGVGKEAVRKGLLQGGGAKVIAGECEGADDNNTLVVAVLDALRSLKPQDDANMMTDSLNYDDTNDAKTAERLRELLGDFFAERVRHDAGWARVLVDEENP